ncbi:AlpA family phage regulatory protein [Klebsiella quasipneumoniae subsp. quasipneumoniae]|uniref:helix-turn-helix transcriptional regulator n=1 Tax=Klebsiella quasipneumoniae TaxID=1463165 RepID=UPI0027FDCE9C|nr:helix-turn-helix domain-containing protein [Klebsiella quasipneumoniae]HBS6429158.1 AlpA family phage regulatory protein [Klebsiella pneumoniae]HCJ0321335.1 AlpA family phage regulatory protein [Klebsiella pneumoniae]HCJ1278930.1 AlpA family phage regulatory protein [Klebsiella pneumoniae]HDU2678083.1 AlpA family phage regulatory protein [Klebsiella pneumoniae]
MATQNAAIHTIPQTGYIRRFRLAQHFGVHVTTVDRWVREKRIPAPVKLGEKITAFDAVEINNWLAERRGKVA